MRKLLEDNCYLIQHELELSKKIVKDQSVCKELTPLKEWILAFLQKLEDEINHNLYHLELNSPETFPQIFKQIQRITRYLRYCNVQPMPSIYRYRENDNICLKLLHWLHNQHPTVQGKAFGISDGQFMIAASEQYPIIYYLPNSSQHILLHLPLFFHELGHYFFAKHKPEMVEFIKELQISLLKYFVLPFQQNDKRYKAQAKKAKTIVVDTWINWIQELFCDAVGIRIGGASYIHAFSFYLRMSGRGAFFKNEGELAKSSHPVPWLRVKFLVKWANQYGLTEAANALDEEWTGLAKIQGIREKYFGYYREEYYNDIKDCLDKMLIESDPISFKDFDKNMKEFAPSKYNFIELTNLAWRKFYGDLPGYESWEQQVISTFNNNTPA